MKKVYALREYYGTERVNLVLFLDPKLLVEALARLERGEVKEAIARFSEASDLYAGMWGTPTGELYHGLKKENGKQPYGVAELDKATLRKLENQRVDRVFYALYPVLTGGEGLALLLRMDWLHPEEGVVQVFTAAHLPPEVLEEARALAKEPEEGF